MADVMSLASLAIAIIPAIGSSSPRFTFSLIESISASKALFQEDYEAYKESYFEFIDNLSNPEE